MNFSPRRYDKSRVREEFGIPENAVLVGMVGRMSPGKGHEEFLNAAKHLVESSGLNLRFMVVAAASYGEESYEPVIIDMARELGVTGTVIFTGFRKDVPRLLSCMDILTFPSHEESFGLVLIEAMAMRLPVVASRSAGVLDVVVEDETGVFSTPKDFRSLAAGISKLAWNPEMRQVYGEAARLRVARLFSLEAVT